MSEAQNRGLSTGVWIAIAGAGLMALVLAFGFLFWMFFGVSAVAGPMPASAPATSAPAHAQPTNR